MDNLINIETASEAITISDPRLLEATEPGQLRVIRRDGGLQRFDADRISVAMKKAFIATEGDNSAQSERIQTVVADLTVLITQRLQRRWPSGGTVHIEAIQDLVELALMRAGEHAVARSYVIYREARHQERLKNNEQKTESPSTTINVTLDNGTKKPLNTAWLSQLIMDACQGLDDIEPTQILRETLDNLFDGVAMKDVYKAMVMSARTRVETDPNYSYVTARLLLNDLYNEALSALDIDHNLSEQSIAKLYPLCFAEFIKKGIELELLDTSLRDFDLERLSRALLIERDQQFTYLSLQTLHDRYFIHHEGNRIELPQVFYMRVAMGLAHCEGDNRNERAIEFYHLLSSFDYMSSTPTLFNAGTCRPQLSSCYLTTVPDDLNGIYSAIRDNAMLSKFAGGLGNDWTPGACYGCPYQRH